MKWWVEVRTQHRVLTAEFTARSTEQFRRTMNKWGRDNSIRFDQVLSVTFRRLP